MTDDQFFDCYDSDEWFYECYEDTIEPQSPQFNIVDTLAEQSPKSMLQPFPPNGPGPAYNINISADQFRLKRLGTVYGTIFGIMPLGAASGVWIAGRMYDTQGNYDIALAAAMIVGLASAILIGIPKYRQLAPEVKTTQSAIPSIAD